MNARRMLKIKNSIFIKSGLSIFLVGLFLSRLSLFESFAHACHYSIDNEHSPSPFFTMILSDSFLHTSQISIVDIGKSFEILVSPITHHSYISNDSTWWKLLSQLFFSQLVGQIFNEKTLATDRNADGLDFQLFLSFCRFNREISLPEMFIVLCKSSFVRLSIREIDVCIAKASSCILIFWKMDWTQFNWIEEGSKLILRAFIRQSAHK